MAEVQKKQDPALDDAATDESLVEPTGGPEDQEPQDSEPKESPVSEDEQSAESDQERLEAAAELLELIKTNPDLQRRTALAVAQKLGQIPKDVDLNGYAENVLQYQPEQPQAPQMPLSSAPAAPAIDKRPEAHDFMPPGQTYNEIEARSNPMSPSAAAREKAMMALPGWEVRNAMSEFTRQQQSQQQKAQAQVAKIQGVTKASQELNFDQAQAQNFYQIIDAMDNGRKTGLDIYKVLGRGIYFDTIVEKEVARRVELALASRPRGEHVPSAAGGPTGGTGGNAPTEKVDLQEQIFGRTPRNVS